MAEEEARHIGGGGKYMVSILDAVTALFGQSIKTSYTDLADAPVNVQPSVQEKFGDYQCSSALTISQLLKKTGKANPREVAQTIVSSLPTNTLIDKVRNVYCITMDIQHLLYRDLLT